MAGAGRAGAPPQVTDAKPAAVVRVWLADSQPVADLEALWQRRILLAAEFERRSGLRLDPRTIEALSGPGSGPGTPQVPATGWPPDGVGEFGGLFYDQDCFDDCVASQLTNPSELVLDCAGLPPMSDYVDSCVSTDDAVAAAEQEYLDAFAALQDCYNSVPPGADPSTWCAQLEAELILAETNETSIKNQVSQNCWALVEAEYAANPLFVDCVSAQCAVRCEVSAEPGDPLTP